MKRKSSPTAVKPGEREKAPVVEVLPASDGQGEEEVEPQALTDVVDLGQLASEDLPTSADRAVEEEVDERSAIVRYDPLQAYLREIQRYPLLTKEEEHDLAVRYLTKGDLEAAYKLVSSNLWLVVKLARDYERAVRSLLDIIQEGNIGLMEAVKNFDPYRGVRFPSYAVWWIKAYIIRYVIANWRMVKIGTTQAQRKLFFNLHKEKEKLEREGLFPGPKLLAEKLKVKESEVLEMEQRLGGGDLSVDAPTQDNSDTNLLAVLPSPGRTAEDLLSQKQHKTMLLESLEEFSSTLKEKELIIFRQRMLGEEKATLQEISDQLSISRERVRQIENRVRDKLKEFLLQRLGPAIETMDFES